MLLWLNRMLVAMTTDNYEALFSVWEHEGTKMSPFGFICFFTSNNDQFRKNLMQLVLIKIKFVSNCFFWFSFKKVKCWVGIRAAERFVKVCLNNQNILVFLFSWCLLKRRGETTVLFLNVWGELELLMFENSEGL